MTDQLTRETLWTKALNGWQEGVELLTRLYSVAQPEAVFAPPQTAEGQTVITASEAYVGLGMGYGAGSGEGIAPSRNSSNGTESGVESNEAPTTTLTATTAATVGYGSGGGGGGGGVGIGRPVAAIIINRDGVRVEPIVDVTKVALAFITMLGSMVFMLSRMRRESRQLEH